MFLTKTEIKFLEKGIDYAPIQNKVNEPELCSDFEKFCRKMRLKCYFRNEPTPDCSEKLSFTPKSLWKPLTGHPNLDALLSELEKWIFKIVDSKLDFSNLSNEDWQAMKTLDDDRIIWIKKAYKGLTAVVWDPKDYILEPGKKLIAADVDKDVSFNKKNFAGTCGNK